MTSRGKTTWSKRSIETILTNEKYVGDVILYKTFSPNFPEKKKKVPVPGKKADFATIEEEYLTTIESLNWPEGVTPPDALEGEDTGASFQIGYGDTKASNLWEYSWMQEWLDTYNTDSERAAKALAELEKAFDMPYMGTDRCDDATRKYLRDNIDKAKLGDPSGFTECIQANYAD